MRGILQYFLKPLDDNIRRTKGVNTQLEEVSGRGTPYWRVQITGFNSYDKALAHSEAVKNTLGLEETWIFRG